MSTYDYFKYFFTLSHDFTRQMLLRVGLPPDLVNMVHHMWTHSMRTMRQARSENRSTLRTALDKGTCLAILRP